jgi:hypothetical protein
MLILCLLNSHYAGFLVRFNSYLFPGEIKTKQSLLVFNFFIICVLTGDGSVKSFPEKIINADLAQQVEQLTCNQ